MSNKSKTLALLLVSLFLICIANFQPVTVKALTRTITVPDDYSDIQTAINHATNGDTVYVRAGNYALKALGSGLSISKPVSIIGENKENTILVQTPYKYNYEAIDISADNATISGFTIKEGTFRNIFIEGSNCKILNNNIIKSYGNGIVVKGQNNTILQNNITANSGFGIYVESNDTNISGNYISDNGGAGIIVDLSKNTDIHKNTIVENAGGIVLGGATNAFNVSNNQINQNNDFGIKFSGCNNAIVYNNEIRNNNYGVWLANYIFHPSRGFGNRIYYNNIANSLSSVKIDYSSQFTPNKSEGDTGNGTDIILWDNGAAGNYWSDYNGKGAYVIDENNVDHYPLTQQVDVNLIAPTPTPSSTIGSLISEPTILAILIVVPLLIIIVSVLLYRRHRKTTNLSK
jgi:parallel beta-helix repeat protein